MRRFRFRLEAILRHRETLEGICEQEFGVAQSRLQAEQAHMDRLHSEFNRCVAARPGAQGEHFDAHAIYDRERYLETLQAALEQQGRRLAAAVIAAEELRSKLVAARQAREVVSRLRDHDLAEHAAEALKQEQNMLDEQATLRFVRAAKDTSETNRNNAQHLTLDHPAPTTNTPTTNTPTTDLRKAT